MNFIVGTPLTKHIRMVRYSSKQARCCLYDQWQTIVELPLLPGLGAEKAIGVLTFSIASRELLTSHYV